MRPNSRALHRSRSLCADENGANLRPRLEPFVPTIHLKEGGCSSQKGYHLYKCKHLRQSMLELRAVPNVPDAALRAVPGATDRLRAVPIADDLLLRALLIAADILLRAVLLTERPPTACSVLATDMFAVG